MCGTNPAKAEGGEMKDNGIDLIAQERNRQLTDEGYHAKHDDIHNCGELAMAAACYASTFKIYRLGRPVNGFDFCDPFPWGPRFDKRFQYGEHRTSPGNILPDPKTYSYAERLDLLTKAGALIAAEIDRLLRTQEPPHED